MGKKDKAMLLFAAMTLIFIMLLSPLPQNIVNWMKNSTNEKKEARQFFETAKIKNLAPLIDAKKLSPKDWGGIKNETLKISDYIEVRYDPNSSIQLLGIWCKNDDEIDIHPNYFMINPEKLNITEGKENNIIIDFHIYIPDFNELSEAERLKLMGMYNSQIIEEYGKPEIILPKELKKELENIIGLDHPKA